MKVFVFIMLDEVFVIYDLCVIEGNLGFFVVMLSKCILDGEFCDIVYFINFDMR